MTVKIFWIISDTQVGSRFAVAPRYYYLNPNNPKPDEKTAVPFWHIGQSYLLKCWDHNMKMADLLLKHYGKKKFDMLINDGDVFDGRQQAQMGTEAWSTEPSEQVKAAVQLWKEPREKADKFLSIRGNDYHDGKNGEHTEYFGKSLDAITYQGRYGLMGALFDVPIANKPHFYLGFTHEPGNPVIYFGAALDKQGLFAKATSNKDFPDPDIMVFGHLHKWMGTEHPGKRVIVNGGWQLQTGFMSIKGRFWRWRRPDIGSTFIILDDESIDYKVSGDPVRIIKRLYSAPKQKVFEL